MTYVAPFMLNDAALGLSITQIGGLTSILPIAYGESRQPPPPGLRTVTCRPGSNCSSSKLLQLRALQLGCITLQTCCALQG